MARAQWYTMQDMRQFINYQLGPNEICRLSTVSPNHPNPILKEGIDWKTTPLGNTFYFASAKRKLLAYVKKINDLKSKKK